MSFFHRDSGGLGAHCSIPHKVLTVTVLYISGCSHAMKHVSWNLLWSGLSLHPLLTPQPLWSSLRMPYYDDNIPSSKACVTGVCVWPDILCRLWGPWVCSVGICTTKLALQLFHFKRQIISHCIPKAHLSSVHRNFSCFYLWAVVNNTTHSCIMSFWVIAFRYCLCTPKFT